MVVGFIHRLFQNRDLYRALDCFRSRKLCIRSIRQPLSGWYLSCQKSYVYRQTTNDQRQIFNRSRLNLGGYSAEVPPLPIPNRVVKLSIADGTALRCGRVGSRHFEGPSRFFLRVLFFCVYATLSTSQKYFLPRTYAHARKDNYLRYGNKNSH